VLREPSGHPQVKGFEERIELTFAAAEATPGFIGYPGATHLTQDDPAFADSSFTPPGAESAMTISLWKDLESVYAFAYSGLHGESLRLRKEWFVSPPLGPTYTVWWVGDGHEPTWFEARECQWHLHAYGPTPHAFTFHMPFAADGAPLPRVTFHR
jgi:uncharacterized protein DUF3291